MRRYLVIDATTFPHWCSHLSYRGVRRKVYHFFDEFHFSRIQRIRGNNRRGQQGRAVLSLSLCLTVCTAHSFVPLYEKTEEVHRISRTPNTVHKMGRMSTTLRLFKMFYVLWLTFTVLPKFATVIRLFYDAGIRPKFHTFLLLSLGISETSCGLLFAGYLCHLSPQIWGIQTTIIFWLIRFEIRAYTQTRHQTGVLGNRLATRERVPFWRLLGI